MSVYNFETLREHVEHEIAVVEYRTNDGTVLNVSLECLTCNEVLIDYDAPEEIKEGDTVRILEIHQSDAYHYDTYLIGLEAEVVEIHKSPEEGYMCLECIIPGKIIASTAFYAVKVEKV